MIDRLSSLLLDTWNGMRWALPALLVVVGAAVLLIDGHVLWCSLRRGEAGALRRWLMDNFWILVGFALAIYLARHYPHDPW